MYNLHNSDMSCLEITSYDAVHNNKNKCPWSAQKSSRILPKSRTSGYRSCVVYGYFGRCRQSIINQCIDWLLMHVSTSRRLYLSVLYSVHNYHTVGNKPSYYSKYNVHAPWADHNAIFISVMYAFYQQYVEQNPWNNKILSINILYKHDREKRKKNDRSLLIHLPPPRRHHPRIPYSRPQHCPRLPPSITVCPVQHPPISERPSAASRTGSRTLCPAI